MKNYIIIFLILILIFPAFVIANESDSLRHNDSLALVALYNATDGANWNTPWTLSDPLNTWDDLMVIDDRVVSLNLKNKNLVGTIPAEIGNLTKLQSLDLSMNSLIGSIPAEIGNCTQITSLKLNYNELSGDVPTSLANMNGLRYLHLFVNELSNMPDLTALTNLSELKIHENYFEFDDIILNKDVPSNTYQYMMMKEREEEDTVQVTFGDSLLHHIAIGGTDNNYQWKQNGSAIAGQTNDTLKLAYGEYVHGDEFVLEVTNATITDLTITSAVQVIDTVTPTPRYLDSLALVALYNETDGANWSNQKWDLSKPLEEWSYITVSNDRVTNIELRNQGLVGTIPEEIGFLTELRELELWENSLSGEIPAELWSLTKLNYLLLADNQLTGSLPAEVGGLTALRKLSLYRNNLSGTIPSEIGLCRFLTELSLYSNEFSGDIPGSIRNLTSLQLLYLSNNSFTYLPSLTSMTQLNYATVSGNQFEFDDLENSYSVPQHGMSFSPMDSLDGVGETTIRNGSNLRLHIPVGGLQNSYQWMKNGSDLVGQTSDTLKIDNITYVDSGEYVLKITTANADLSSLILYTKPQPVIVDPSWREMDSLALVALYNATDGANWSSPWNLNNAISTWSGVVMSGGRVSELKVNGRGLTGTIPAEIGNLSSLFRLYLDDNNLSGSIPSEISNLQNLLYCHLENNSLSGTIPPEFGDMRKLKILYLDHNVLTGAVPAELNTQWNDLVALDLSDNKLDSMPLLSNLTDLTNLDIRNNNFDFDDVEINKSWFNSNYNYIYDTMNPFTNDTALTFIEGDTLSLNHPVGGLSNSYQWTKDGADLAGQTSPAITINTLTTANAGKYVLNVTSSVITDLILYSDTIDVTVHSINSMTADSLILVRVYNETDAGNWSTPWDTSGNWFNWPGVTMSGGRLTSLRLNGKGIIGNLPVSISRATKLSTLELRNNNFTGAIPSEYGNFEAIQVLRLSGNDLSDTIPTELGQLSTVEWLDLDDNSLSGTIPMELHRCTELAVLKLANNDLVGTLHDSLGYFDKLQWMHLSGNNLSGEIPKSFRNLTMIESFELDNNQFTGTVPLELDSAFVNNGSMMDISGNRFDSISRMPNVHNLKLSNNAFDFYDVAQNVDHTYSYTYAPQDTIDSLDIVINDAAEIVISASVGGTGNTYQWYKNGSELIGETTDSLVLDSTVTDTGLYHLQITNASMPDLTLYTIQQEINYEKVTGLRTDSLALVALFNATDGPNWRRPWTLSDPLSTWSDITIENDRVTEIDIYYNELDGTIPDEICNMKALKKLRLRTGNLTGSLPDSIGKLTELTEITLSNNNLSGVIPVSIVNCTKLKTLDLSYNSISGKVLDNLTGLTALSKINFFRNRLVDTLPPEIVNLTRLTYLNLGGGSNAISGELPSNIGNLTLLTSLYLSNQELTGTIPASLGNIEGLRLLDLEGNNLTGEIPEELANCSYFHTLLLGGNNLSGDVPDELNKLTSLKYIELQNNDFTDVPHFNNQSRVYTLNFSGNRVGFEPIELNTSLIDPNFFALGYVYSPMDSLGGDTTITTFSGDPAEFFVTVSGDSNSYQWLKDGVALDGATSDTLKIDTTAFADSGSYVLQITNSVITDLTLYTKPMKLVVEHNYRELDSLALLTLYDSTNGNGWTTGWNSAEPMENWHGVTVTNNRVTALNLDSNNLIGAIPAALSTLDSLKTVSLTNNSLHSIPALNLLLDTLSLENNNLHFDDIANNSATVYIYASQDSVGTALDTMLNESFSFSVGFSVGGQNNRYQWYKDGIAMSGETTDTLHWDSLTLADSGIYQLQVTDSTLAALTLTGYNQKISIYPYLREQDSLALVALYNSTDGANWTNSWDLSKPLDSLYGITMLDGRVSRVELANNNLQGTIPAEIGQLSKVFSLNLSYHENLTGSLPSELGNMGSLMYLSIAYTGISGSIPSELSNLQELDRILFNNNSLNGSIPSELGSLPKLEKLILSDNNLSGTIPVELANLDSLSHLYLNGNQLVGDVPAELAAIDALEFLVINNNKLENIPSLAKTNKLEFLFIENNRFEFDDIRNNTGGVVNSQYKYYPQDSVAVTLDTTINQGQNLRIHIPVGGPVNTYQWFKDGVALVGQTSDTLKLDSLTLDDEGEYILKVDDYWIQNLSLYSHSQTISVNRTEWRESDSLALIAFYSATGGLDWTITWDLTSPMDSWHGVTLGDQGVTRLSLNDNNLIGHLPPEIGSLPRLTYLGLYNSSLNDTIPSEIGNLKDLEELRMVKCELIGEIPQSLEDLTKLEQLRLSFNQLTGPVPQIFENMPELYWISLYENDLTSMPSLSNLTKLSHCYLEDNKFHFDDIMLNQGISSKYYDCNPQDSIGADTMIIKDIREALSFSVEVRGEGNEYIWLKDGVEMVDQTSNTLTFASLAMADSGVYVLKATNPSVDNIRLYSYPCTLKTNYVPILTESRDTTHSIVYDTITTVDSVYSAQSDTIVTTIVTEYETDSLFIRTDSLSDGVSYWFKVDTVVVPDSLELSRAVDTLDYIPTITVEYDTTHAINKDTVISIDSVYSAQSDTVVTMTVTENWIDSMFVQTDSLSDEVVYWTKIDTTVTSGNNVLSNKIDTLKYIPIITVAIDTTHAIKKDTVTAVDSVYSTQNDTVVTTIITEDWIDSMFVQTDSLSDGTVYWTKMDTSVTSGSNVLSTKIDTLPYIPTITVAIDTTHTIKKDTVTAVDSVYSAQSDTVVTTTITENWIDSMFVKADSLSDGVVYWTKVDTSVTSGSNILSTKIDTLKYIPTITVAIDTSHAIKKDTVTAVDSVYSDKSDTVVTTIKTENWIDSMFVQIDSLSDGVIYWTKIDTSVTSGKNVLSTKIDTLKYIPTITVAIDTTHTIKKDTATTVTEAVQANLDTIITTTITESWIDSMFVQTDSLSDGSIYWTKIDTSVTPGSQVLSVVYDTLFWDKVAIKKVDDQVAGVVNFAVAPNIITDESEAHFVIGESLSGEGRVFVVDHLGDIIDEQDVFVSNGGHYYWDLRNSSGTLVTSGIYLVVLELKGKLFKRKIAIKE